MPGHYEQSIILAGLGTPSDSRGTKRPAVDNAFDNPNGHVWKRKPSRILTPGNKARNVGNPYNALSSSSSRTRDGCGNPTAKMTTVNSHSGKRSKTNTTSSVKGTRSNELLNEKREEDRFTHPVDSSSSKYWNGKHEDNGSSRVGRAIPSVAQGVPGSLRPKSDLSPTRGLRSTRRSVVAPFIGESNADIISIDESEPEVVRDSGPVNRQAQSRAESEGRDEIDLFSQPSEEVFISTQQQSVNSNTRTSNNRRTDPDGRTTDRFAPKYTAHSSRSSSSRDRPHRLAEDGQSTKRLGQRLRGHIPRDTSPDVEEISSFRGSSLPLNGKPDAQNATEEIEELDLRIASSSRRRTRDRESSLSSGRELPLAITSLRRGRVGDITARIEKNSKLQSNFIEDLRKEGKSRVNAMKGKSISTVHVKLTASHDGKVSSRDKQATVRTPYDPKFALPLELCFWGAQIFESSSNDPTQAEYWLWWNNSQLQLHKSPLSSSKVPDKPVRQIDSSVLRRSSVTISASSNMHILRVELKDDLETSNSGLMFKARSQHPTIMDDWKHLTNRLKRLLTEQENPLQFVRANGVPACYEAGQKAVEAARQSLRDERMAVVHATQRELPESPDVDKVLAPPEKKQPKPRPAHGKNHDQMRSFFGMRNTRQSSRLSAESTKQEQEEQPPNLDEIILVYGAVNVTSGDLRRLEPSEFLNDSLIELGLKFWLYDLRERQPELAESIHVFSSFFFKKLASKSNKNPEDGYQSVRKWTAKVDVFKKKYIIVPINENMHWYLALIYHPEHILEPAPPKPAPRISQRVSNATSRRARLLRRNTDLNAEENLNGLIEPRSDVDTGETIPSTPVTKENDSEAEAEVEGLIDNGYKENEEVLRLSLPEKLPTATKPLANEPSSIVRPEEDQLSFSSLVEQPRISSSMKIDHVSGRQATAPDAVVDDSLSESIDEEEIDELEDDAAPAIPKDSATPMDVDDQSTDGSLCYPMACSDEMEARNLSENTKRESRKDRTSVSEELSGQHGSTVPTTSFYGDTAPIRRTNQDEEHRLVGIQDKKDAEPDELDVLGHPEPEHESSEEFEVTDRPRTIIFGMDSLGSSHPKALSRLSEYLQEEARDKKGISNPSPALTKKALVPTQPNFCDCGLYLLHFAQTFINDPEKYKAAIFSNKKSSVSDRNLLWRNEEVGTMREKLKERIITESTTWKASRAEKDKKEPEDKPVASGEPVNKPLEIEESDDEIEVSEVRHVGSPQKKQTKRAASTPAARLR